MDENEVQDFLELYGDDPDIQPMIEAIANNDLDKFKTLLNHEDEYGKLHIKNDYLMRYIVYLDRFDIFNYALSSKSFQADFRDKMKRTILMNLAFIPFKEKYAESLIAKGADVNASDFGRLTYLHLIHFNSEIDHSKLVKIFIDHGAHINALSCWKETPLFLACGYGNCNVVDVLLYYGADPTIPDYAGRLPIFQIPNHISEESQTHLHDILFYYYSFANETVTQLSVLANAMRYDTALFVKIVENVVDILYDNKDLTDFINMLHHMTHRQVKVFVEKFGQIVTDLNDTFPLLVTVIRYCPKTVFDIFAASSNFTELIQAIPSWFPAIVFLITKYRKVMEEEELTKIACLMFSYGLDATSRDLDDIYDHFGSSELFKISLHMNIIVLKKLMRFSLARLYYDLNVKIEDFENDSSVDSKIFDYYNNPKLKEIFLTNYEQNERRVAKVNSLPQMPSLIELSRNVARKFIVDRYRVKNAGQFYTILQSLPIGEINKKIIALEVKLY